MVTTKINVHLHARVEKPEDFVVFLTDDMAAYGYVYVTSKEVEFDLPSKEVQIPKHIECLRKEQQRLRADASCRCDKLDEVIAQISCLEYRAE